MRHILLEVAFLSILQVHAVPLQEELSLQVQSVPLQDELRLQVQAVPVQEELDSLQDVPQQEKIKDQQDQLFLKIRQSYEEELQRNNSQASSNERITELGKEESHEGVSNLKKLDEFGLESRASFLDWIANKFDNLFASESTSVAPTKTTTFSDVAEEGLAAHNEIRGIAPHYGTLLSLDENLCLAAESWANYLASEDTVMKDRSTDQGENIAVDWSGSVTPPSVDSVVASWYEEKDTGEHCMEHYTQIVWKDTKYFCMARARSRTGAWFMVARYWPKGPREGTSLKKYEDNVFSGFGKLQQSWICTTSTPPRIFSDVAEEALAAHNAIRMSSPHYRNPLVLDQDLCEDAQAWADHLSIEDVVLMDQDTNAGENIALTFALSGSTSPPSADSVVSSWYAEKDTGENCMENYIQMVWKDTKYFCMARSRRQSGGWFMVARYWPKGPKQITSVQELENNVYPGFQRHCSDQDTPVFSDVAEEGIAAHNAIRASSPHHGSLLLLDQNLCNASQAWADHLASEDTVVKDKSTDQGENIAVDWSGSVTPPSVDSVVASWYEEKDTGEHCMEHYTQMVWKDTKYFCMARARSQTGAWFMVARYFPKGPSHKTSVQEYENNVHHGFKKHCFGQPITTFSEVAKEGLSVHNQIRGSTPHYGAHLGLDQKLCDDAQAWADLLASEDGVRKDGSTDQGENIAVDWSGSVTPPSVDSVVASWYEEKDTGEHCMEHYTQMVWKDTRYFCMAQARSQTGAWFMVARYFPKGPSHQTSVQEYENNVYPGFRKLCTLDFRNSNDI